jgi:hypothetical protein
LNFRNSAIVQVINVDVSDTCVPSLDLTYRPTHDFDAVVSDFLGRRHHVAKALIGENRAHETELHGKISSIVSSKHLIAGFFYAMGDKRSLQRRDFT